MSVYSNPELAKKYEEYKTFDYGAIYDMVWDLDRSMSVLDIGCGTGRVLKLLVKWGFGNIYGIEKSKEMYKLDTTGVVANMPFQEFNPKMQFDMSLLISSLHLLTKNQHPSYIQSVFSKIAAISKQYILIESVDTEYLQETTLATLFPDLYEFQIPFPIIVDRFSRRGFDLVKFQQVQYTIPIKTSTYISMLKNRFISALQYATTKEIQKACKVVSKMGTPFCRKEAMAYGLFKKRRG